MYILLMVSNALVTFIGKHGVVVSHLELSGIGMASLQTVVKLAVFILHLLIAIATTHVWKNLIENG